MNVLSWGHPVGGVAPPEPHLPAEREIRGRGPAALFAGAWTPRLRVGPLLLGLLLLPFGGAEAQTSREDGEVDMDLTGDADLLTREPPSDGSQPDSAQADQPLTENEGEPPPETPQLTDNIKRLELGGVLGWTFPVSYGQVDPFRLTVAGRGGLVWTNNLYTGATTVVHLGSSEDRFPVEGVETRRDMFMTQLGLEVGVELALPAVLLRPYGGFGLNHQITTTRGGVVAQPLTVASDDLYASAGCVAKWALPAGFYVGADGRLTLVLGSDTLAGLVLALAGGYQL